MGFQTFVYDRSTEPAVGLAGEIGVLVFPAVAAGASAL